LKRIFFVEDNDDNAEVIEGMIQRCGYETLRAATGEELLHLLSENIPDLILVDIELPGINGRDLLQIFRADPRFAHLPIVAMSGGMGGSRENYLSFGFNDFLAKPFRTPELKAVLVAQLEPAACNK